MEKEPLTIWQTIKKSIGLGIVGLIGGIGGAGTNYVVKQPTHEVAVASPITASYVTKEEYLRDKNLEQKAFFDVVSEVRDRLTTIETKADIEPKRISK